MRRVILFVCIVLALLAFLLGCAATVYVPKPPPPAKVEVKPPPPGHKAVWVEGHWKWSHGKYVWVPGHWVKKARGKYAPGHWQKRPGGWVWVKGRWHR